MSGASLASAVFVDRLTGRRVLVTDPEPQHPAAIGPFVAQEVSVRCCGERIWLHVLECDGVAFTAPPSWISACPENVVPLMPRQPDLPCR